MLIATLVPSSQRMQLVDLTSYVTVENFKLLIPVQEDVTNNASAIIKPFQWQVNRQPSFKHFLRLWNQLLLVLFRCNIRCGCFYWFPSFLPVWPSKIFNRCYCDAINQHHLQPIPIFTYSATSCHKVRPSN